MKIQTNGIILEKLELSNFSQFKEKQGIEFSKDNRVTIIQGGNGSGKSSLVTLDELLEQHNQDKISF